MFHYGAVNTVLILVSERINKKNVGSYILKNKAKKHGITKTII